MPISTLAPMMSDDGKHPDYRVGSTLNYIVDIRRNVVVLPAPTGLIKVGSTAELRRYAVRPTVVMVI